MGLTIKEAKDKAIELKEALLKSKKINKKLSKEVKEIIKLADDFIRCHSSNDAVFKKYAMLKSKLSEFYND